jgi:hypothetical protein
MASDRMAQRLNACSAAMRHHKANSYGKCKLKTIANNWWIKPPTLSNAFLIFQFSRSLSSAARQTGDGYVPRNRPLCGTRHTLPTSSLPIMAVLASQKPTSLPHARRALFTLFANCKKLRASLLYVQIMHVRTDTYLECNPAVTWSAFVRGAGVAPSRILVFGGITISGRLVDRAYRLVRQSRSRSFVRSRRVAGA